MTTPNRYSDLVLFRRLFGQARSYWPHIGGLLLLSLLSTPLALLSPLPLKIAVDSAIGSHPLPGFLAALLPEAAMRSSIAVLALAAVMVVGIALLNEFQQLAEGILNEYTGG